MRSVVIDFPAARAKESHRVGTRGVGECSILPFPSRESRIVPTPVSRTLRLLLFALRLQRIFRRSSGG
jgi:hypothetical protein